MVGAVLLDVPPVVDASSCVVLVDVADVPPLEVLPPVEDAPPVEGATPVEGAPPVPK
jgi:hypothetical protein